MIINMSCIFDECFKFNEDSLFEEIIGPAFESKLEFDQKIDNGSNSRDSITKRIKVRKIKAVTKLNENSYSEPKDYWYYDESGIVYDIKLYYYL